ncbi:hypothetical protein GOBAR_DD23085 [Gossypium barbadense]|nr:hypothetical protein GOBAR_DD23085 [Gossypium barbadense]
MATFSPFSLPLHLIPNTHFNTHKSLSFCPKSTHLQTKVCTFSSKNLALFFKKRKTVCGTWKLNSAEEEAAALPVSPTSTLRMYFQDKWKPLQTLALSLQIHSMDKLLEDGLNIDEVDKDGHTALHKAIIGKREAVISHLLRKGANPHVKDKDGATPLHYAVHVGALQTVKLLLKYDVDVNVADQDGWTPLHVAVQSRNRDIAKILLINGADKTRKNKDGKTALDLSLCYGKDFKSYDLAKLMKILPVDRCL